MPPEQSVRCSVNFPWAERAVHAASPQFNAAPVRPMPPEQSVLCSVSSHFAERGIGRTGAAIPYFFFSFHTTCVSPPGFIFRIAFETRSMRNAIGRLVS